MLGLDVSGSNAIVPEKKSLGETWHEPIHFAIDVGERAGEGVPNHVNLLERRGPIQPGGDGLG